MVTSLVLLTCIVALLMVVVLGGLGYTRKVEKRVEATERALFIMLSTVRPGASSGKGVGAYQHRDVGGPGRGHTCG